MTCEPTQKTSISLLPWHSQKSDLNEIHVIHFTNNYFQKGNFFFALILIEIPLVSCDEGEDIQENLILHWNQLKLFVRSFVFDCNLVSFVWSSQLVLVVHEQAFEEAYNLCEWR